MTEFIILIVALFAIAGIMYAIRKKHIREANEEKMRQRAASEEAYRDKIAKRKAREREEDAAREKLRQHPNYGSHRFNPMNPDVLNPVYKDGPVSDTAATIAARKRVGGVPTSQTQFVSCNSVGIQSRGSVVYNNSTDDLLTAMILQNAMNSQNDVTAGTVSWSNNVPTITETPAPVESSYSSSYSSPSSSYSSSSSSDSDSSSRSSYSSSYSSSSDSSSSSDYSSSSSDSSSFSSD